MTKQFKTKTIKHPETDEPVVAKIIEFVKLGGSTKFNGLRLELPDETLVEMTFKEIGRRQVEEEREEVTAV